MNSSFVSLVAWTACSFALNLCCLVPVLQLHPSSPPCVPRFHVSFLILPVLILSLFLFFILPLQFLLYPPPAALQLDSSANPFLTASSFSHLTMFSLTLIPLHQDLHLSHQPSHPFGPMNSHLIIFRNARFSFHTLGWPSIPLLLLIPKLSLTLPPLFVQNLANLFKKTINKIQHNLPLCPFHLIFSSHLLKVNGERNMSILTYSSPPTTTLSL